MVDAGQMHLRSHAFRLIKIEPRTVEAPEVVKHRHLKLQRIMAFQIEALVALHGIRGRMRLRERIARKRLNLPPDLLGQRIGIALSLAVVEKPLGHLLKLTLVTHLMTHHAAQHIGFGQVQSGEIMPHLEHVFLVNHHAVSLFEKLFQDGMLIVHRLRMMEPLDVFLHHP